MRFNILFLISSLLLTACAAPKVAPTPVPASMTISVIIGTPTLSISPIVTVTLTATPTPSRAPTATASSMGTPTPHPLAISPTNAEQVIELAHLERDGKHVAWSSNGEIIAVASGGDVYLYDAETLQETHFISASQGRLNSTAISPDGRMIVTVDGFGKLHIWSVDTDQPIHSFQDVFEFALSPDGQMLALVEDGSIVIWDIGAGERIAALGESEIWIPRLVFSPDANTLAEGRTRSGIRIWDISLLVDDPLIAARAESIEPVMSIRIGEDSVASLTLGPDARLLAYSDGRALVQIWDVKIGQLIHSLRGHGWGVVADTVITVWSIAFSPSGNILASGGGMDQTVRLWDVRTGQLLKTLEPEGEIPDLAFSPDGRLIVSGGEVVRLWGIPEP